MQEDVALRFHKGVVTFTRRKLREEVGMLLVKGYELWRVIYSVEERISDASGPGFMAGAEYIK
jgi:hypothetical protein